MRMDQYDLTPSPANSAVESFWDPFDSLKMNSGRPEGTNSMSCSVLNTPNSDETLPGIDVDYEHFDLLDNSRPQIKPALTFNSFDDDIPDFSELVTAVTDSSNNGGNFWDRLLVEGEDKNDEDNDNDVEVITMGSSVPESDLNTQFFTYDKMSSNKPSRVEDDFEVNVGESSGSETDTIGMSESEDVICDENSNEDNNNIPFLSKLRNFRFTGSRRSDVNCQTSAMVVSLPPRKSYFPREIPKPVMSDRNRRGKSQSKSSVVTLECTKNAIQARVNRQKKKAYISGLEQEVETLQNENERLHSEFSTVKERADSLNREVDYLRAVLYNQSALAGLIKNINGVDTVDLMTSSCSSASQSLRKRSSSDDHDYGQGEKRSRSMSTGSTQNNVKNQSTGGVCLHVSNQSLSLEFCHMCAQKSHNGRRT